MTVSKLEALPQGEPLEARMLEAGGGAFPDELVAPWLRACRKLAQAGYGEAVAAAYAAGSPAIARAVAPAVAIEMADTVSSLAIKAGRRAAALLPEAAIVAARHVKEPPRLRSWLTLIERLAAVAPESCEAVLERTDYLLANVNVAGLDAWVLAGLRVASGDAERRLAFFSFADPEAERWLHREAGLVGFHDLEGRLKPYGTALFRLRAPMREPPVGTPKAARRRSGFGGGVVRLPVSYPGFVGAQAVDVYHAAVAHIGAHFRFTRERFPLGALKPVQVAIVSIIEDARVEQLALRDMPGLKRLWLPFHVAQPSGLTTAPSLMARLARSLIDADYADPDSWVRKGRDMFFGTEARWEDQKLSREIGNLLGNDLGQMRVQLNAKTYVVQPPYRDDNLGLWDFGEQPADASEAEALLEAARLEAADDPQTSPERERRDSERPEDPAASPVRIEEREIEGVPVARYPEYDYVAGRDRPEWTTILEYSATLRSPDLVDRLLDERADLVSRLTALIRSARVARAARVKRQPEGEFLDLDAAIEAAVSQRAGETPDPRVYGRNERRNRDLSVMILLDVSESTRDRSKGSTRTVLDVERQATALLAHAMSELGDPFGIAAFRSNRRDDVQYVRVKDFAAPYDARARAALAGLESGLSTRLGAAIRHAGAELARQNTHRRLLLVVTDGEPSDIDVDDPKYLVEDARRAVVTLAQKGIDCFCVGLDPAANQRLARVFGRRSFIHIESIEKLPARLPMIYLRLTA
jgi:nitric oxide reductase NorD protein